MNKNEIVSRASEILEARYHVAFKDALPYQLHDALSRGVMAYIAPQWTANQQAQRQHRCAYYLSAEYLIGRLIYNNLFALGILEDVKKELADQGAALEQMEDIEDAALGNGGLGRLAACFLDSAATHDIPLFGYGLYYQYGLFKQEFAQDRQVEKPDDWTQHGDPWSIRREDKSVLVHMKGLTVKAVPYDMPVIGYQGKTIGTLRLWKCESLNDMDFVLFNEQKYTQAVKDKNAAEDITKLLYPNDTLKAGKMLRVKQQYVLCSATLQDLIRDYKTLHGKDFSSFAALHALQLNDTHPTMSIPELIRLLEIEGVSFENAFDIAKQTFAYTNHTVMQEALEKWDVALLHSVAPEMTSVIKRLSQKQEKELDAQGISERSGLSLLQDGRVHMAYLAMYGGHAVNGVAEIHTEILKNDVLHAWYTLHPEMFQNKTNGITQRRWLGLCNPELSKVISTRIGDKFLLDLDELAKLKPLITADEKLTREFIAVKKEKKAQLCAFLKRNEGFDVTPDFVFDVQVKRLHEYKRQLLNAFSILDIYCALKEGKLQDLPKTLFLFGAKSAPGYDRAKAIIRFINQIADKVNADPDVNDRLKVLFVHNYNCSYAEKIIPAADISEQISPAGTEASGTGNMKLMLNGAVTLGTYDGANIEIVEQAGRENNYIFGATLDEINRIKDTYSPTALYEENPRIKRAVDKLTDGTFEDADGRLAELHDALLKGASWHKPDHYYLLLDFIPYIDAKIKALRDTQNAQDFVRKCLYNVAGAGKFSSDRTIKEYAQDIWHV